jgi:2-(1,2-epoxy-1,2-dihydrophenyl)acetyl-CoA isomerase
MNDLVLYRAEVGIATVTLNRPDRLNTMTDALLEALLATLEKAADDEDVRVVILGGAGRAFCAGGDLAEGVGGGVGGAGGVESAVGNLRRYMRTAQLLHEMPKPTIAAIKGACAGAGLSLACAADLRYASTSAVFNTAFIGVGLSGDFGGTWTLTRIVGTARAREAYLLAERFGADEAERIGLVSKVVPDDALMDEVTGIAERLAAAAPIALRSIKANLNDALQLDFPAALEREAERHIRCGRTDDAREATNAFLEKRPPVFRGT